MNLRFVNETMNKLVDKDENQQNIYQLILWIENVFPYNMKASSNQKRYS